MTIIAARRYADGKVTMAEVTIDGAARAPLSDREFDWVGIADPTADEMEQVASQFGLHRLAVEDALNGTQMPKVDTYGHNLFIAACTAAIEEGEKIGYGQTAIFLGSDFLVSVRLGSTRAHHGLRQRLEALPDHLSEGPDFVAHAILDFIVDGYLPVIERLEDSVHSIEARAIESFPERSTIRRIFRLRRQLRRFERMAGPMEEVCDKLSTTELAAVDASARIWFRDVLDHVRRAMARMRGLMETLDSVVETAALLEQHRQGQTTRQLAAWAAILAVPTAIAGIYGMNFDVMPELRWRYGYGAIVGAMASVCLGLWWNFRRRGWL